jgi:hypothetical protein
MKWLEGNPLGMVLVVVSGVCALLALGMAIVGTLPVSVEMVETEPGAGVSSDSVLAANKIGSLAEYQVVIEKPVFNESRRPVIAEVEEGSGVEEDATIEVKDAPDVRLTGVIITPSVKIASLTPADANLESVTAYEGQLLTGEFVGWQVSEVNPRDVHLESRDGQTLVLDLQVHDVTIEEPPAPAEPVAAALAEPGKNEQITGEDEEPLSRAEQIRQRIAERREELRLEQESQNAQSGTQAGNTKKAAQPGDYQSAIRALMIKKSKDQGSNDKKDG